MSTFHRMRPGLVELRGGGYWLGAELAEAVNVSLLLERPLLLTGEPGTGKTTLAAAVARALERPLFAFDCKSTSVGRDLLYTFDHLQRLYDAQHPEGRRKTPREYVKLGALGEAIERQSDAVVLVDEIDKAPRDFPNDLLREVETCAFAIRELDGAVEMTTPKKPFIIVTSNRERQLPAPFLRRCTFHHIEYPNTEALREILKIHTAGLELSDGFLASVTQRFERLRAIGGLVKKPATDELIAWTRVLHALGVTPEKVAAESLARLPGLTTLFKTIEDLELAKT